MAELMIRTAVVTGAGSGLGRALCLHLARRGARMLIADIDLARCEETARLIEQAGGTATAMQIDVTDAGAVEQLGGEADRILGRIDLVINNAGVAAAGSVGHAPLEDWRWIVGVNLWGVIHGCHVFAPRLARQGGGALLNVASLAGIACAPNMASYNVTKAGVIALSETLAAELADNGVRVTVLCPGFFRTNLLDSMRTSDPQFRGLAEAAFARSTMSADEVAAAALRSVERGELYCLPMREARIVWRLKRLLPFRYPRLVARLRARMMSGGADAAPRAEAEKA